MTDIICLSSDEEEQPKKKRVKLTRVPDNLERCNLSESIILSDDDEDSTLSSKKETNGRMLEDKAVQDDKNMEEATTTNSADNEENKVDEEEEHNKEADTDETTLLEEQTKVDLDEDKENNVVEEAVDTQTEIDEKFHEFCARCRDYIEKLDERQMLTSRMDNLVKAYVKLKRYDALEGLDTLLYTHTKQMDSGSSPMVSFYSVFKWAHDNYQKVKREQEKKEKQINTLIKTMNQLVKRIGKLKEAEVDLDDEEGSSYVKCEAYERRVIQIHNKLCKLEDTDPNEGRITYSALKFSHSTNRLINKAINYKYKDSNFLPDFYQFNKFLRKIAERGNIEMSEEKLKSEIRSCFETLTKLIKRNRQKELYEVQNHFVEDKPDPTLNNNEFNAKIREGRQKSIQKMNDVINKYVELQETGGDPPVSSDSENSNFEEQSE